MTSFLEKHYIAFTRIIWVAIYLVMLYLLNFAQVYNTNDILTFLLFVFGIYFTSKMITAVLVVGVAAIYKINVDIELKQSFTINGKYVF